MSQRHARAHPRPAPSFHRRGVLPQGRNRHACVELLEGQIIDLPPIGPLHSGSVNRLTNLFARRGGARWIVNAQNPVHLSGRFEPQPDFVLLRPRDDFYASGHPTPADVFLLVEVSDSSGWSTWRNG